MTKVEDRIESVEKWIANFQEGNEESLVFSNMNFLVAQLKGMGDRLTQVEQSHIQLQNATKSTISKKGTPLEIWNQYCKESQYEILNVKKNKT